MLSTIVFQPDASHINLCGGARRGHLVQGGSHIDFLIKGAIQISSFNIELVQLIVIYSSDV